MVTTLREMAELRAKATEGPVFLADDGRVRVARTEDPDHQFAITDDCCTSYPDAAYFAAALSLSPEAWSALAEVVEQAKTAMEWIDTAADDASPFWDWLPADLTGHLADLRAALHKLDEESQ